MKDGKAVNQRIDSILAPYAQRNEESLGRVHDYLPDPHRTPFQRDRDRIIHSNAFRRLKGKMQVVPPNEGDHFRNRLTHTLEVASISRDIARLLGLNEDLAEAIALAHDLGHPPFGHSGEIALQECLLPYDEFFEHNKQSLRVVTHFIKAYPDHPGLNLSVEVLKGLKKHATVPPTLEAQLVDIADEIAYIAADTEDGLRGKFFTMKEIEEEPLIAALSPPARANRKALAGAIVGRLIKDLVQSAKGKIEEMGIKTQADVIQQNKRALLFYRETAAQFRSLKTFLFQHYYESEEILSATKNGKKVIMDLFLFFKNNPELLPKNETQASTERQIADHIAGMTDAFAQKLHAEYHQK